AAKLKPNGTVTVLASQVNNDSTDNCGMSSLTLEIKKTVGGTYGPSVTFSSSEAGPQSVTLRVTDAAGNSSTCTATVTVQKRGTKTTYSGAITGQYSDCVTVIATLVDIETDGFGGPVPGQTIKFTVGSSSR